MNRHDMVKRIGAAVVAGGLVFAFAGPAMADTTTTVTPKPAASTQAARLDHLKQACEAAIDRRLGSLGELLGKVSGNEYLTASDKAALSAQLGDEKTGLAALRLKIAGDTDLQMLRADCKSIVTNFRVYLLMAPKVHLVIAADYSVHMAQKLTDLAVKLQVQIDKAKGAGKDVTKAQQDLNAMKAAIGAGLAVASPVPGKVLPLQPKDYPGNKPALDAARQDLKSAHDHFVDARTTAKKVVEDLKALRTPVTTPTH